MDRRTLLEYGAMLALLLVVAVLAWTLGQP